MLRESSVALHIYLPTMTATDGEPISPPAPRRLLPRESNHQTWTATRCHRLLRPLLSNISALRRDVAGEPMPVAAEPSETGSALSQVNKRVNSDPSGPAPRKKIRHTYSARYAKKSARNADPVPPQCSEPKISMSSQCYQHAAASPGQVVLPTPVLRRARGYQLSSPIQHRIPPARAEKAKSVGRPPLVASDPAGQSSSGLESELRALRKSTPACRYAHYESVFRALEALLRATGEDRPAVSRPKSLLAMCLRKVPAYVAELEWWEQRDAEESGTKSTLTGSSVSFDVYSELESLGGGNWGWRHLRTVARAHGIKIIGDAIVEGLLGVEFPGLLVRLCAASGCFLEAEDLLAVLVRRSHPKPASTHDTFAAVGSMKPLQYLRTYAVKYGRSSFLSRTLSQLLSSGQLPHEWLSTREFSSIWSVAVKDLSGRQDPSDTKSFIATSIGMLCSKSSQTRGKASATISQYELTTASKRTLLNMLSGLAALLILGQEALEQDQNRPTIDHVTTITRRIMYIIQSSLSQIYNERRKTSDHGTYLLELTTFFARTALSSEVEDTEAASAISRAWSMPPTSNRWRQQYESTMALMSGIAQCCGRGASSAPHTYLTKFCDQLETLNVAGHHQPFRALRLDAAFSLAERTGDLRDLAFAESLADATRQKKDLRQTPARKTLFAGFRWDEGFSEWVTVSPVLARKAAITLTDPEDSGRELRGRKAGEDEPGWGQEQNQDDIFIFPSEPASPASESGLDNQVGDAYTEPSDEEDEAPRARHPEEGETQPSSAAHRRRERPEVGYEDELSGGRDENQWRRQRSLEWHAPRKKSRARASLQSRLPLKSLDNALYICGSSDDELW